MWDRIFGNGFDLNGDGETDAFERNAQLFAVMEMMRQAEGIDTPLEEMSDEQRNDLAARSGINPDGLL